MSDDRLGHLSRSLGDRPTVVREMVTVTSPVPSSATRRLGAAPVQDCAMDLERTQANLRRRLQSMPVIEQAKGIIMGLWRCDADAAFDDLVNVSRNHNRKLRDVASALVLHASQPRHTAQCDRELEAIVRKYWVDDLQRLAPPDGRVLSPSELAGVRTGPTSA